MQSLFVCLGEGSRNDARRLYTSSSWREKKSSGKETWAVMSVTQRKLLGKVRKRSRFTVFYGEKPNLISFLKVQHATSSLATPATANTHSHSACADTVEWDWLYRDHKMSSLGPILRRYVKCWYLRQSIKETASNLVKKHLQHRHRLYIFTVIEHYREY